MVHVVLAAALLLAGAPAESNYDAPERAADKADRLICKKFLETGSLVRGQRVCKTKREWEYDRDLSRARTGASNACPDANTPC